MMEENMIYGYTGKILRVNLSTSDITIETPDQTFYRMYMGGKGIIAHYLLKEVSPEADALGAENKLIFATGVLTGIPIAGTPRYTVGAKSPLTGGFGQSEAGGFWGPELKKAGWDAVIIEGKAEKPVYLSITDSDIQINDAAELWGKETGTVQQLIREELGEQKTSVLQIGPAGENMVKYACITNNLKHYNGRNGMGAVMGSKNLRAIAVKGSGEIKTANPEKISELRKEYLAVYKNEPLSRGLFDYGTSGGISTLNAAGMFPSRNFKYGENQHAEEITGQKLAETIMSKREGCFACPVRCKRVVDVNEESLSIDPAFGGPEYETIAGFGANCMMAELKLISKANELCNRFGMDTISVSGTIAFAMECFENGLIDTEFTNGLRLEFGNSYAVLTLLERIALRADNFSSLLAEGSFRAAEKIGKGSEVYLNTSRKQEYALHDARTKTGLAFAYSTAANATDHMYIVHDTMISNPGIVLDKLSGIGIYEPISPAEVSWKKARNVKTVSEWTSFQNCAGMCILVFAPRGVISLNTVVELLRAATGWEYTSLYEIMKAGERAENMGRAFNILHGSASSEDNLSQRSHEDLANEHSNYYAVDKKNLADGIKDLFEMRGWDENGIPSRGKLYDLNLGWLAEKLHA